MVQYIIINSTNAELTNVNVGGDDVAAYTISGNITLTDAELATVASLNGVAVMQADASSVEQDAVADLIISYGIGGSAPAESLTLANGSENTVEGVAAYTQGDVSLAPSAIVAALGTDGVAFVSGSSTVEGNRKAARVLTTGTLTR